MEFRLTYEGALFAHQNNNLTRAEHRHQIRRAFHEQLKVLWHKHPIMDALRRAPDDYCDRRAKGGTLLREVFEYKPFRWLPIVTETNGLICKLDILMLRPGKPGDVPADVDNRVKTLIDALRIAKGKSELTNKFGDKELTPTKDEDPFYVLLEDDKLITHLSVTSDMLLEPVRKSKVPQDSAVRITITVTVRPYHPYTETVGFA